MNRGRIHIPHFQPIYICRYIFLPIFLVCRIYVATHHIYRWVIASIGVRQERCEEVETSGERYKEGEYEKRVARAQSPDLNSRLMVKLIVIDLSRRLLIDKTDTRKEADVCYSTDWFHAAMNLASREHG